MKQVIFVITVGLLFSSCLKKPSYERWPYQVEATQEVTTNFIRLKDLYGGYRVDSNYTELTFLNFYAFPSFTDMIDSVLQKEQPITNAYYRQYKGTWTLRYVGSVPLVQADSLKLRTTTRDDFNEQVLTLSIDRRLWGKPLFEVWHEPTGTVYARYTAAPGGGRIELRFSGARGARLDTLDTKGIADQFNFKLTPGCLSKPRYLHG